MSRDQADSCPTSSGSTLQSALVSGLAAAVCLWTAWFITHLPWVGLDEKIALPCVLATWVGGFALAARRCPDGAPMRAGLLGGFFSALLGLLVLGSKLRAAPGDPAHPHAAVIALGFLTLGGLVGLLATALSRVLLPARCCLSQHERFAWIVVAAAAPLLFIGGLVTSTNSGMAVPDWPNTFGANMFLYPLGPRAQPSVFLEHSHRLFGTLLGCGSLALLIWTLCSQARPWVKGWTLAVFLLIVLQGVLGGLRVLADSRGGASLHGVLAQVIFAGLVGIAVYLSRAHAGARDAGPVEGARAAKALATGAMHSLLVQLLLGAVYRHLRHAHVLYTHAAFAVIVSLLAVIAAFKAMALADRHRGDAWARGLKLAAALLVGSITLQFVLGWVAFAFGGQVLEAQSVAQALIRTAHQANGALVLGATAGLFLLARALWNGGRSPA